MLHDEQMFHNRSVRLSYDSINSRKNNLFKKESDKFKSIFFLEITKDFSPDLYLKL